MKADPRPSYPQDQGRLAFLGRWRTISPGWRQAAGASDEHPRHHLVLLKRPQLAAILVQEMPGGRPNHVLH